ncbi:hypothetical protein Murru_0438 [Allomuricauda ruestringensis DSM 13258]|uniref:Uncharacterized protein n=1 Tax=Allomuricauda ruestringensis (strain DSM 13258 / CIP 107369 / LMG 19739 / B1) TaxID=886377 RepID=G2PRP3_ALLRU|nr:hypothetical protein Murru_0438 [Allomuricauda ruestringensis DSM 13258]
MGAEMTVIIKTVIMLKVNWLSAALALQSISKHNFPNLSAHGTFILTSRYFHKY